MNQEPNGVLQSFEMFLRARGTQTDFNVLSNIKGDRAQKARLQLAHNTSGILCFIQFDSGCELAESSQIIRDCIMHAPICE